MISAQDILHDIFNKDVDEPDRNPNDPSDQPFFSVKSKIVSQAFHNWMSEQGGEIVLDDVRKGIRNGIIAMIGLDVKGFNDVLSFVTMKQKLKSDMEWYINIVNAFAIREEVLKETKE